MTGHIHSPLFTIIKKHADLDDIEASDKQPSSSRTWQRTFNSCITYQLVVTQDLTQRDQQRRLNGTSKKDHQT